MYCHLKAVPSVSCGWALLATLHLSESEQQSSKWGFYPASRHKIESTSKMPQTPVRCWFKVLKRITTLVLLWINEEKKNVILCKSACWYAFISVMPDVWIWTVSSLNSFLVARCVVTAEELPAQHSLSAHCAKSSQTRPFSYYFLSGADTHLKANIYQEKWSDCVRGEK